MAITRYYELVTGDEYDTLYIGETQWEGSSTSYSLTKNTKLIGKNDLPSGISSLFYANYSSSAGKKLISVDFSSIVVKGSGYQAFAGCENVTDIKIDSQYMTDMSYFCSNTAIVALALNLRSCTNMSYCFNNCSKLISPMITNAHLVTNWSWCFANCTALTSLTMPVTKGLDLSYLCYNCSTLAKADITKVAEPRIMSYAFQNTAISSIEWANMDKCLKCDYMFYNCDNLETIDLPDMPCVYTCAYMFNGCNYLTSITHGVIGGMGGTGGSAKYFAAETGITTFDFADINLYNLEYMFYKCSDLTTIQNFQSSVATYINNICESCSKLSTVEAYFPNANDTHGAFKNSGLKTITGSVIGTTCYEEFYGCTRLTTINDNGRKSYTSNKTYSMFYNCTSLVGGNGTKYDSSKYDGTMAVIDDSNHTGYLTGSKDKELITITINPTRLGTTINQAYTSYNGYELNTGGVGVRATACIGDTIKPLVSDTYNTPFAWIITNGTTQSYLTELIGITVLGDMVITPIGQRTGGSVNALISAVVNP